MSEGDFAGEGDGFALTQAQVTIVGLGLMGGSLALALQHVGACREVWGVARRRENVSQALAKGALQQGTTSLEEGVAGADIVVLALPVRAILEMLPRVGALVKPGCLVLDLGSTKAAIVQAMRDLPAHVRAIGAHPMCGKETSGFEAAERALFRGARFVLTPLERTDETAMRLALALVRAVGAYPLLMDAERHDVLVAAVSHLPYLASVGLVAVAEEVSREDQEVWDLAASGFRDATRLAASEVRMMSDILATNRRSVLRMMRLMRERLENLETLIASGDEAGLQEILDALCTRRRLMFQGGNR